VLPCLHADARTLLPPTQKKPLTRKERDELLKKKLQLVIAAVKQNRTDTSKVEVEVRVQGWVGAAASGA